MAVPDAVDVLLPIFGSVTPEGGATVAVLEMVAPWAAAPVMVTVTLLLAGNVVTGPLTSVALELTVPQTAPPDVVAQLGVPVRVNPAGSGSS